MSYINFRSKSLLIEIETVLIQKIYWQTTKLNSCYTILQSNKQNINVYTAPKNLIVNKLRMLNCIK